MDSVSYNPSPRDKANEQDNIPLADPAELFDSIEYKQSGSVFWADLNKDHRMSPSFLPPRSQEKANDQPIMQSSES
jgi:hypothetical protein